MRRWTGIRIHFSSAIVEGSRHSRVYQDASTSTYLLTYFTLQNIKERRVVLVAVELDLMLWRGNSRCPR